MQQLAELAVHALDGGEDCSISLATLGGPDLKTVAAAGKFGNKIDALQRETGEGPCLSSIEEHAVFHIPNMRDDDTWPKFSKAASEIGVRSMVCYVLRLSENSTGAMNMIATKEDAFSPEDVDTGTIFAAQAAVAMSGAITHEDDQAEVAQLEEGMKSRQMIGQAVGILMSTRRIDADEAFRILQKASQDSNIKLRAIAERVVDKAPEL